MFKAYGLYSHIRANELRSAFLLAGFVVLLLALMFSFALLIEAMSARPGAPFDYILALAVDDLKRGWPIGVIAAGVWFVIAYLFHQKMIDFATGAANLSRAESPRVYNLLENLCISRGVPIPALQLIESDALNAYASGLKEGRYKIAVTRGLTRYLTDAELEAVLAHELTHIRNRDVQLLVIAVIFAGIFAFVADLTIRRWDFPFGFSPHRPESDNGRRGNGGAALAVAHRSVHHRAELGRLGADPLRAVALARVPRRRRQRRTDEEPRRDDLGAARIEAHAAIPNMPSRMQYFFIETPALHPEFGWLARDPAQRRCACRGSRQIRRRPGCAGRDFRRRTRGY